MVNEKYTPLPLAHLHFESSNIGILEFPRSLNNRSSLIMEYIDNKLGLNEDFFNGYTCS